MRGTTSRQPSLLALVSMEQLVPENHPLRRLKPRVDAVLKTLSPTFEAIYSARGRPSVPPEQLLKGTVLMALFSVRSERQLCEQLAYNMLFRWFLDMEMMSPPFDATAFSHNRARLLEHDVARQFLSAVVDQAREEDLVSDDHFSVDGTLIEAWASMKSFRPKGEEGGDNNGSADFKGTTRSNETHESKTDPESRIFRKGRGKEAKMSFMAHVLMENRHGLITDAEITEATGTAERDAAGTMVERERRRRAATRKKKARKIAKISKKRNRRFTVGADKGYDTKDMVKKLRQNGAIPHVAQNRHSRRDSSVPDRVAATAAYRVSQTARRLIEKIFGWTKTIGGFRRSRYRGLRKTEAAGLMVLATYNLLRLTALKTA